MKYILQIAAHLTIGGAEKVARDIGMYANPEEYEIHYVIFDDDIGDYGKDVISKGCKIFKLREPSENYSEFFKKLKEIMSIYPYDAVHAHTMFSIGWVMLAAKQMIIPVRVSHAHSALINGKSLMKSIYESVMRCLILAYSTDLVACGEKAGQRLYGKRAYKKRGKLILNGVNTEEYRFSEEKRYIIRNQLNLQNNFVLGHTGRLADIKNQSFLIELMPDLLKKRNDAKLILLGDGDDREMLEEKVNTLNLKDNVIFAGSVCNVQDYLSAMDVFVFPSLYEGMPLSILEVQANGLPCVISDTVPPDVFLTDLIHPLSLNDSKDKWIEAIISVKRNTSKDYPQELKDAGFDTQTAMEKVYRIYEN
ncbi:MAG: glycosyltransferase [Clostridia bacterium]|nr:glycosyltransferase [Clostridia bacterium]